MNNSSYDCASVLKWMQESNLHDQWHVAIDNKPLEGILTIEQVRHLTWDPRYEKTIIQILNVQHANTPNPVWLVIGERLSSTTKTDPNKTDLVSILTMGIGVCALPLTAILFPTRRGEEGLPSAVIILILLFCVGLILFLPAGTRKYGKQLMISMVIGVFVWVGILVASGSAKL